MSKEISKETKEVIEAFSEYVYETSTKPKLYDLYVTDGGSNQCYQNGMWGNCGEECSVYGSRPECFDNGELNETNKIKKRSII